MTTEPDSEEQGFTPEEREMLDDVLAKIRAANDAVEEYLFKTAGARPEPDPPPPILDRATMVLSIIAIVAVVTVVALACLT